MAGEKKKKRLDRVPTGIPGLDNQIEGGFVKGSVNLVAGSPGAGKSIFAVQFIVNGIEEFNEPGIYISFGERKEEFYKYMLRFGWDLAEYEKKNKFAYIKYSPSQVNKLLKEGGGIVDSIITNIGVKRIAIDSITSFSLLYKDELASREGSLSLFDMIATWGCTTVLTSEQESGKESTLAEFEVDSVILLYNARKKDIRQRVAEILKMRGTKFAPKVMPIKISEQGLVFYPDESVF